MHAHSCFRVDVLPPDLVGIKPTAFSLAVINTSLVTAPADAETLAIVLQEQLLKVCKISKIQHTHSICL